MGLGIEYYEWLIADGDHGCDHVPQFGKMKRKILKLQSPAADAPGTEEFKSVAFRSQNNIAGGKVGGDAQAQELYPWIRYLPDRVIANFIC